MKNFFLNLRSFMKLAAVPVLILSTVPIERVMAADPNQLYVTPASYQMNIGTPVTVNLRSYSSSSQSVGSVSGSLSYPTNLLKIVDNGISTSGSAYGNPAIGVSAGTVTFSGTRSAASSGSAQIFSITFQAVNAGIATVSFNNNSTVNNSSTIYKSGVYTISNPNPPASQPSQAPQPVATPKPSPAVVTPASPAPQPEEKQSAPVDTEPQPAPDPTGLIDNVSVDPLYQSSDISWKVNASNAKTLVVYGISASQLDKTIEATKKADGSFTVKIPNLTPGLRYYFTISATGDGNKSGNYSGTLLTRGFPVTLNVTENNSPVKSAQIKIGSRSYSVANGKVSIGLASGSYNIAVTTDSANQTFNLSVATKTVPSDGSAPPTQTFSYNLTSSPLEQGSGSNFSILTFIGILVGGTALLGLGFLGFMAYRRHQFDSGTDSISTIPSSSVIIEDGYDWHTQPQSPPRDMSNTGFTNTVSNNPPDNSVHIDEEPPLDIFEQAKMKQASTFTDVDAHQNASKQNPS